VKKNYLFLTIFLFLFFSFAFLYLFVRFPGFFFPDDNDFSNITLREEEIAILNEGDIILQSGLGIVADSILWALNEKVGLTHAAVLIKKDSGWHVIQSINTSLSGKTNGVHLIPLNELLIHTRPQSLIVVRPKLSEEQHSFFLTALQNFLEAQTPFDNNYSWSDSSEVYCSELIIKSLMLAGWEINPKSLEFKGPVLAFRNFLNPDYFQPILSHHKDFLADKTITQGDESLQEGSLPY